MRRTHLGTRTRRIVAERAGNRCEYCRHPDQYSFESFAVEHILPLIHPLSSNALSNLAYACGGCNGIKGIRIRAVDPLTQEEVALFHPRQDRWRDHFGWSGDFLEVIGLTPTGRATVAALSLNRPGLRNLRRSLLLDGAHPPVETPAA